jgi:hypothetical protein
MKPWKVDEMTDDELSEKLDELFSLGYATATSHEWGQHSNEREVANRTKTEIMAEIATLRKQVEAGKMLAEAVRHVDVIITGDWLTCPWCYSSVFSPQDDEPDSTPEFHHAPDCPRQLALAAWDAALKSTKDDPT